MSNGVGIAAALSGSIPVLAGPRPSEPDPEGSLPPRRAIEAPDPGRRPSRSPDGAVAVRTRTGRDVATGSRPPGPVSVAGSSRSEDGGGRPAASKGLLRPVVEALQSVPVRDATRVRLTLTPAHLGELWIELSVAGSGLRARVRTQTEAARRLILAHLDDLREDLERRGIRIRRFEVDVGDARLPEEEMRKRDGGPGSVRRQVLDLRA